MERHTGEFELVSDFEAEQPTGGLGLGVLETQYEELFAEALEDGVITEDERERLEKAAHNLGLDPSRLTRLEEAMTASYETHHRVRVVDQSRSPQSMRLHRPHRFPQRAQARTPRASSARCVERTRC